MGYAITGLRHAYKKDLSFRLELHVVLPAYLILGWFLAPFQAWELIVYIFSYLLILIVELVNTAFETMLDKLHPEKHDTIGKSKDISSSAVLLAFVFAAVVCTTLLLTRLSATEVVNISRQFV